MSLIKKWTSLFLVCAMLLGMVPVTVFAEAPEIPFPENPTAAEVTEVAEPTAGGAAEPEADPEDLPEAQSIPLEEVLPDTEPVPLEEVLPDTEPVPLEEAPPEGEPVFDSQNLTKLEIETLPGKRFYQMGEALDLTGIRLYAEDCIGLFQYLSAEDLTLISGDASAVGSRTVTLGFGNLQVSYEIFVHTQCSYGDVLQDSAGYPESPHNYPNSTEETYSYRVPGAQYLTLVFSGSTYFESGYDYLTVFDGEGSQLGRYTGNGLSGTTVTVPGDTVSLFLDTDGSTTKYGFSLDSISAYVPVPVHEPADAGVYTDPLCFVDGYTTHTCWICGEVFVQTHENSAGHSFADGICGICGLPEVHAAGGMLSDTIAWAITEDNTLFVTGSGDMPEGITWPEEAKAATALTVGHGITALSSQAFYGMTGLQSVRLPDTLVSIGTKAFRNCSALTNLYIPAGVSVIHAGSYSNSPFYGCDSKLVLYCAADQRQEGWEDSWNYRGSGSPLTTNYGFTPEDHAYWTGFDNAAETIQIREGITAIPSKAFYECKNLTQVTLPESLKTIGEYAFYGCKNLTQLSLPDSVATIGRYAFANCTNLEGLTLPASLETLGVRFLSGASKVKKLTFPASLTGYGYDSGDGVLSGSYVETVAFDQGVAVIPDYALCGGSRVTDVTMPDTVTTIGSYAFSQCGKLQTLRLSEGLTAIGSYAFSKCSALTQAEIPLGVTVIEPYAFQQCSKLSTLTLPESLTAIGEYAFYKCSGLTALTIPDSVALIGDYAFADCAKMVVAGLPAALTQVGKYAFSKCAGLTAGTFPRSLTAIGEYAFNGCTGLTAADLSSGMVSIGNYAFNGCGSLASVTLPDTLTELGHSVFYGCFALTELRLPASLTTLGRNGNRGPLDGSGITKVIFADGFTAIPAYALSSNTGGTGNTYSSRIREVIFEAPDKITAIGTNAFYNCAALEALTLPSGITVIPERAFNGCGSLASVTLPESLTTVSKEAFYGCSALASLDVPASVTAIGDYAFRDCGALTKMTLPEGLQSLGYSAFYGCFALTELRLPASLTSLGRNGNRGPLDGSGITKVIFADGFTAIPAYALSSNASGISHTYASRIKEVVFEAPDKITQIENHAFYNCLALESIAIPEQVVTLSGYAFAGCQSLNRVEWNSKLETVGEYSFQNCGLLSEAVLPDSVTDIGKYAFSSCSALENVEIPAGAAVRSYAFRDCQGLKTLTIGDNAHIYSQAFSNCSGITAIHMGKDVILEKNAFHNVSMSGECGESMTWSLNIGTGTMVLNGSGEMTDYTPDSPAPWSGFASMIRFVEFGNGVSDIGTYAFAGCTSLEGLVLPDSIRTLSENSFQGCDSLVYLELPDGIQHIGSNAFGDCVGLEEVVFLGDAPVMEDNCFGSAAATVRYPETASGFISRIFEKFIYYIWTKWDDTVPTKDVVILLDTSGSMDGKESTLSSASSQLIKSIGGAIKKTRIAVVEYDSGTNVLSDFTSNVYHLSNCVASLEADGGTEYRTALNKANTMITGRNSDIKFVIMFSDGEPNDNKNNIYTLANTMREQGIIIYTVGLLSSSSQRQVLINVAGSESRYFEATNIAGLIAAFEELSRNFGKSEYSTVEMKINDERHDIFSEPYTLCLTSEIPISFYFTPGTNEMYNNVSGVAIEQDGRYVLSNTTGIFENIIPGNHFQSGKPIYMVMLDAGGNVIERKELLLNFTEGFRITYTYGPDMENRTFAEDYYIPGEEINAPGNPQRFGYYFDGWYSSENCEGIAFFHEMNEGNRLTMNGDIVLYAKWQSKESDFLLTRDSWQFTNSYDNFGYDVHYEMTNRDWKQLIDGQNIVKKIQLFFKARDDWGGSCFGMSSSAILARDGLFDIYDFPSHDGRKAERFVTVHAARLLQNTKSDDDVGNIESMINFYHLKQYLSGINGPLWNFSQTNESANVKEIIRKMRETDEPVLINLRLDSNNTSTHSGGYHSVVGYDLKETANGYTFRIYDCSVSGTYSMPVNVTVDNGVYTAECNEWESKWSAYYNNIHLGSALTESELDQYNILTKPGTPRSGAVGASGYGNSYELYTNYGSFTISNGAQTAVIANGQLTGGDLDILCLGQRNSVDDNAEFIFVLPVLHADSTYTITQNGSGNTETVLLYDNGEDGFFVRETADASGVITISDDGTVTTRYADVCNQEIWTTQADATTPWYAVGISGASTAFAVTPAGTNVGITSAQDTQIDVYTVSDFNNLTIADIPVDTDEIKIQENEGNCTVTKDGQVIADSLYGYSVVFDSNLGTNVSNLLNVPYGSLIDEPTDPTKAGCIFQGWFSDEALTTLWDFTNDTVTQDTILYAGWTVDPNYLKAVTFRVPGREDQIVYIPKGDVIPAEYAPLGDEGEPLVWYTNAAYTSAEWNFETDTVSADTVLYGKTTLCTVSYVTGTEQALESSKLYSGMKIPRPTGLVLEGSTLCGWYTDEALTREWNFESDLLAEDTTLYAKWLPNELDKQGNDTGICIEILREDSYVYTGKAIKPEILVRDAGRILTPGVDYTVTYKNNTNARSKDDASVKESKLPQIIVQGKGNYKSAKKITKFFTIHQAHMQQLQVTLPGALACKSGNKLQTLKATVSTGLVKVASSAYTLRYYTDAQLTETVKGITGPGIYYVVLEAKLDKNGNYSGNLRDVTDPIAVEAAPAAQLLSSAKITLPKSVSAVSQQPEAMDAIPALISKVTVNKTAYLTDEANLEAFLQLFAVTAVDTDGTKVSEEDLGRILTGAGKKTLILTAREGNSLGLVGEKTASVTVKGAALKKNQFRVTFDQTGNTAVTKAPYTGLAQTPTVISSLTAGRDYTVSFKSGKKVLDPWQVKNAGSYSLVITGKGAYSGSLSFNFSITKVDIAKAYAAGNLRITSAGQAVYAPTGAKLTLSAAYLNDRGSRISMAEGTDYTLSYSGNKTVTESASMTLKGKGNFSGTLTKKAAPELIFSVTPKDLAAGDISVTVNGLTVKKGQITGVKYTVLHAGKTVSTGQYTGQLTDNGDETLTLTITGKGKLYTGTRSLLVRTNLIKATDTKQVKITLPKENRYYTGSQICPQVIITDAQGNDISHCFSITYGENTRVGSGSVTVTGLADQGYYGTKTLKFTILPKWTQWLFG